MNTIDLPSATTEETKLLEWLQSLYKALYDGPDLTKLSEDTAGQIYRKDQLLSMLGKMWIVWAAYGHEILNEMEG